MEKIYIYKRLTQEISMNVRSKEDLHEQKTLFQFGKLRARREKGIVSPPHQYY